MIVIKFRPCIDIHNGKVKQIVGGTLRDKGDEARTNFTAECDAAFYAEMYRKDGLAGGHIILLNPVTSEYYEKTKAQALLALRTYPNGMQIGGGITAENAQEYLDAGASHVIVTSYIFQDGKIHWDRLEKLVDMVGKDKIVIDLSCRKRGNKYYIVTDRWQKFTEVALTTDVLNAFSAYCDEFLIHGVDVEGTAAGVDEALVAILAKWEKTPITYAGGIGSMADLKKFEALTGGKLDYTIGSALDLFGGTISYEEIVNSL